MVNGFGALLGSFASGIIIDKYFTLANGSKNWHGIWLCFAGYALVIAIIFPFIFRFNNDTEILTGAEPA
jgi:NHS family xanthosine MFS transporter